ncbi:MAG: hypothetical protein ABI855_13200 [Bacteroidota bacterium]
MIELSKKEKKAARELIEKGLQKEFAKGLFDADSVLHDWKSNKTDNITAYHTLYKTIKEFDRHIGRRYDYMKGSKYIYIIAGQLADEIISENDLKEFNEETQKAILVLSGKK